MTGKKLVAVLILVTGGCIYYFSGPKARKEFQSSASNEIAAKPHITELSTLAPPTATAALPAQKPTPQPATPVTETNVAAEKFNKMKIEQAETEKLKEFNKVHVARVSAQMKSDEIVSLKKSILNDQQVLKKIEKDGSNIELYQLVRANLEKRKSQNKEFIICR